MTYFPAVEPTEAAMGAAVFDQFAPAFTQAARSATSASFNLPPIGIFKSGSVGRTAETEKALVGISRNNRGTAASTF